MFLSTRTPAIAGFLCTMFFISSSAAFDFPTSLHDINVAKAKPLSDCSRLDGCAAMYQLDEGVIYLHSKMDIDADGSPNALEIDPEYGQLTTAYNFFQESGQRRFVDAETVPYFVLPAHLGDAGESFVRGLGLRMGDIAAVQYKDRVAFAMLGDVGPEDKIGEGSVALAKDLGFDPFTMRNGMMRINERMIQRGVTYIIFPNSRIPDLTPENAAAKIRERGRELLAEFSASGTSEPLGKSQN